MKIENSNRQISMFDFMMPEISVNKPIRLIELFGGYGSQAMALKRIGANFEHYKLVEFDPYAVASYNAVHGTKFKPADITKIHANDLDINDEAKYTYMMTYSFPCQDLSLAGKRKGMTKGSGTRSGLLWEVERLLKELKESGKALPEILFMENVPQVISSANIADFNMWQDFLKSLGYTNFVKVLNAKDYGVAQNRERCFMFSFLGNYNYHFPEPIQLEKRLKDYLEVSVDEKYYIKNEKAKKLIDELIKDKSFDKEIIKYDVPQTVTVRKYDIDCEKLCLFLRDYKEKCEKSNQIIAKELNIPVTQVEHWFRNDKSFAIPDKDIWKNLKECLNIDSDEWDESILSFEEKESNFDKNNRIYDSEGIAPTLTSTNADEKIIEPKCLNSKGGRNGVAGLQPSVQDRVYDPDGISTAVTTSFMPNILEKNKPAKVLGSIYCENSEQFGTKIMPLAHTLKASKCDVAIVEKLNDEPKINIVGNYSKSNHDATRIVETNGLAPTVRECHGSVTAIVEDEAQINMLGLLDINGNDQVRRVYGVDGLSPTLNTMQGGNTQPKIIEGKEVSVAAIRGRYNEEGNVEQHLEKGTNEYSNTITTVTKDNVLIEKDKSTMKKVGQISTEGSQCGSVYSDNGLFPTLSAGCHGYANPHIYTRYRIRKLTPVECGRLMDVDMDDIIRMIVSDYEEASKILEYMRKNNITYKGKEEMDELIKHQKMSNSRLYKQYGNSIVVGVMCAMFRNLNIKGVERWSD